MKTIFQTFSYSVGKKLIMSLTGLFLILFLTQHAIGNALMFAGPDTFNAYAEFMGSNVLVRTVEIFLFLGFILHIVDGIKLAMQNAKARPVKYAVSSGNKNSSWFSRNMAPTGIIILVFLILHLISFFLKARFGVDVTLGVDSSGYVGEQFMAVSHGSDYSLWHKAVLLFSIEWYSAINIAAFIFVGFHLNHGFQSAFQTIGLNHRKYTPLIKTLGKAYSVLIPLIYISIPVYFLLMKYMGKLDAMMAMDMIAGR